MAFEINDLKGILILVLIAIPTVASTNINCSGRAFHCVNSTHFMICVDLGGGVSTTIDDFVIPCPATTECHENNIFECDFPEVTTTPPLQVIGVNYSSDTSEPTLVTNSVTTATPTSDIFSVVKENITATILPIAEDVTPVVKLEVLENIMTRVGVNNDSTTETSVTSSLIDSKNDIFNDKRTSNNTVTTSATDNNKHIEHAVETSIHEALNTSSTDKSISIDTVTSVIGLINLISTDPSSEVSTKPSSNVLTSLDSSNDNIATTTEQYNTKEVTIHSIKIENVTDKLNIPTDIIFSENSVITDEVSTTTALNTLIVNDINNGIENKTNAGNQRIAEQNSFVKSNNLNKIVQNTTTEYVPPIKNVNISKPVDLSPQTTTDNTLLPLGQVDLISAEQKQSIPRTNDYIDTFLGATTATTTNHFNTKLETTLSDKPVILEIISTTPIPKRLVQNVLKSDKNHHLTGDTVTFEKVTDTNTNSSFSGLTTVASMQTSTEKTFVPITTEITMVYTTETIATSEALFKNDFPVQKQTIVTQLPKIIVAANSSLPPIPTIVVTDNFYQRNGELTKNISVDTMNTTEENSAVYNDSGTDIIYSKDVEPVLLLPSSMKNPAIEITTTETLQKGFTATAIEVANEPLARTAISDNEPLMKNAENDTLLNNATDTMNTTETVRTVFNALSSDIAKGKGTEPITKIYPTIEILKTESLQKELTKHAIEAKNELPATNGPINVNEHNLENVRMSALFSVHTTNAPYKVTSDPVQDLTSQSDIVTNPQAVFTLQIIARKALKGYASKDHATTQKPVIDYGKNIPEALNQPDILEAMTPPDFLNVDQWAITVPDVVTSATTSFTKIENNATTPLQTNVTGNNSISEIDKSGNQDNISATSFVNTEDVSLKIMETSISPSNQYLTELLSTTPETVHTSPSMDSIKNVKQVSTNTLSLVSTTDNKIETSTMILDATLYTSNFENITNITATTLPQQNLLNQKQYSTTAATKSVGDFVPSTKTTSGYELDTKNIDLNTSNQTNLVSTETMILNIKSNQTEAINPINGKNSVNATFHESTEKTKKDESIKIMPVLDIVNASGNAMPIEMLQPTSSNPPLSNDYIKTSESQASSVYVSATDNVPDYNSMRVEESVSQKNPVVIMLSAETKAMDSILTTSSTRSFPVSEINKEKNQYVSTEAPIPNTVELNHIKSTKTAVDKVMEKTNGDSSTETTQFVLSTQQNSAISLRSVTPYTATLFGFTKVPVYDGVAATKDSAFITSSIQMIPEVVTDNNTKMSTESPRLTSKIMVPQTVKYKTEFSLPPARMTTESTRTNILAQTTPLDKTSQSTQTGIKTTVSPQYVMPTINTNIPQSMPSLRIVGVTASQMTTESTETAVFAETTPLAAINKIDQNFQPGKTTTDYPQYLTSKVNNNSPQSMHSLPIIEGAAAQITTELTHTTVIAQTTPLNATCKPNQDVLLGIKTIDLPKYVMSTVNNNMPQSISSLSMIETLQIPAESTHTKLFAQTKPLAATGDMNLGILSGIKSTDLPHYVSSIVGNNIPQPKPSLPLAEVTAAQITTEPTHKTKISGTTPLAAPSNTVQDILPGIKTTDLSQYTTTTLTYYNAQSISDITTKTIVDSLTTPDSMVETIKVVENKESETHLGEKKMIDVMFNSPTVDNVKRVKNIIDHESIVVGITSKNDEQNTSITFEKPVDINKAEIVNHTESNWMPANVNIDNVKIKESSIEEGDLKFSVLKSGAGFKYKTLALNSPIISQMQPKDGKAAEKIEYNVTTVSTDNKQAESGAPKNVTQSKTIITDENKNAEIISSVNANIEIIDVKKGHVPADTKNIFDSYSINNTKVNISSSNHNLSLQNSTINDELEQHLISTNHTITTEVQSHLNESDKQSNKTSNELTLNGTSVYSLNLTSRKLNASSENTTAITVPASVFNCLNLTRGKYSDKKDCRKFYTCIGNLQPVIGTCPNNTVFSEINKQCTRNLSHCVRNNQFRCLFEGRFSDFFKDNIYYICVKNRIHGFIRYKLQCQDTYHLNKDSVKCEKNEEISTQSGSVSETINDESRPKPKSEKIVSSDEFECEKVGKFPYAKDCNKYYECTKVKNVYRRKIKKCASDEVFDKKKTKCVESDSGEC